jgi:pyruvate formate lyase activating enzyme
MTDMTQLEETEGVIFDIQRYSLHDGPGLRTNLFLKGCPLRCQWCCNPESVQPQPELAFFDRRCFLCGDCLDVCATGALNMDDDKLHWNPAACDQCGRCVQVCTADAMRWIGRRVTASEVMEEVIRDLPFYTGSGGITLTGGEPTLQPAFAEAVLRLAKQESIHTAIETCGYAPWPAFERLLPWLDLVLYDIKHMDSEQHRQGTGISNEQILHNARRIAATGNKMIIRVPLIPQFNITEDNLRRTGRFALDLTVEEIHLLPYHRLGQPKYRALGRPYPWAHADLLGQEAVEQAADALRQQGLRVYVGS